MAQFHGFFVAHAVDDLGCRHHAWVGRQHAGHIRALFHVGGSKHVGHKGSRQVASAASERGHLPVRISPHKSLHQHHLAAFEVRHGCPKVFFHARPVHRCTSKLTVCDDNVQGRQPCALKSFRFQQGMHDGNAQPLPHADQRILGVVAEFMEQLKALTNRAHIRQSIFDLRSHSVGSGSLQKGLAGLQVT